MQTSLLCFLALATTSAIAAADECVVSGKKCVLTEEQQAGWEEIESPDVVPGVKVKIKFRCTAKRDAVASTGGSGVYPTTGCGDKEHYHPPQQGGDGWKPAGQCGAPGVGTEVCPRPPPEP
jgi:hypothetical protein